MPEFKQRLTEASFQPGVSIFRLALDNGINANLLFKWRQKWRQEKIKLPSSESGRESQLIPVTIDAELPAAPANEPLTARPSVTPEIHNISSEITFRNGPLRFKRFVYSAPHQNSAFLIFLLIMLIIKNHNNKDLLPLSTFTELIANNKKRVKDSFYVSRKNHRI